MRRILFVLLLSSTLAFGQAFPPDTDKDVAVGFGTGLLTNVCIAADQVLTTTGTIEEILASCTIPGTTFPADFAGVEIIATYVGAANANSKTMNVRVDGIAGTIVLEVTGDTDSGDTYELSGYMTVGNGGSGNLSGSGTTTQGTGASTTERMRVTGLTFASDIDVVFTGLTASSAGDVTLTSYMVRLMTGVEGDSGGHWNGGTFDSPAFAPDGALTAPAYSFTRDSTYGMLARANGVFVMGSEWDWVNVQPNIARLSSKISGGGDQAEILAQANYGATGNPAAFFSVANPDDTSSAGLICTTRDSEEGCTISSTNGTSTATLVTNFNDLNLQYDWTDGVDTFEIESNFSGDKDRAYVVEALATGVTMGFYLNRDGSEASARVTTAGGDVSRVMAEGQFAMIEYTDSAGFDSEVQVGGEYVVIRTESAPRMWVNNAAVTLTAAVATSVVRVAVASGGYTGFTVNWTVVADDATDFQSRRGSTYVAAVNQAGTETCTVGDVGTPVVAVSSGTLTVTTSCATDPTNAVDFEIDADSSLTETTLEVFYTVVKDGIGNVTPQ